MVCIPGDWTVSRMIEEQSKKEEEQGKAEIVMRVL